MRELFVRVHRKLVPYFLTGWTALQQELEIWKASGTKPKIWWRDDDAVEDTPALCKLVGLVERFRIPLLLAVIPAGASTSLARRLDRATLVTPCQHGFAHVNHAAPGMRACELGGRQSLDQTLGELESGRCHLSQLFNERLLDVLVPPWNRIGKLIVPRLPEFGFRGLSTGGWRTFARVPGLLQVNTHVDIIDWKLGRKGISQDQAARRLAFALAEARARDGAPVGLLTHHLAHDEIAWRTLEALLTCLARESNMRWLTATELWERSHRKEEHVPALPGRLGRGPTGS
jgi:hypothetical protein